MRIAPKISVALPAIFLLAIGFSLSTQAAAAASHDKGKRAAPVTHRIHHLYATYGGAGFAQPATLPHAPEYGFLRHVPPNAIRMPGYTFVPGVGILGEFLRPADERVL